MALRRKVCLTISKALENSILMRNPWSPHVSLESKASRNRMILSMICLLGKKPHRFSEIIWGIIFLMTHLNLRKNFIRDIVEGDRAKSIQIGGVGFFRN